MNILYLNNKEKFIAYNKHTATKKKAPFIIFNHGLMSDMNGEKAIYLENFCQTKDYNFIRFDNFGCGQSSGLFLDQTISSWQEGLQAIINMIDDPIILIGSSLGAWIVFLATMKNEAKISGIVTIAAAFDCTEKLIYEKLSTIQKQQLNQSGSCLVTGTGKDCSHHYPISLNLIEDGKKHLILNQDIINIKCPVHLIHGCLDIDVPCDISKNAFEKIQTCKSVLKLIKDGDHRLSREQDLKVISNSIEEIMGLGG
ncbi:MAG: alpha/beta hydrolase [Rickettsiales bacterium]|nr:MAG: alpha/beta hydrolase [Rickettsiales bacterium]